MKKLLTVAIVAAVSAPTLADVKLYGQLHASYDALSGATDINTVASNSSRIGVKGSSDLNNDLKVIYQAEWGIDTGGAKGGADKTAVKGGGTSFVNRNQVVGIAGGFGAVLLGRHDTPFKTVGRKADLFWNTQLGQNRSVTNPAVWDQRGNNVVAYQTPKFGGFQSLSAYITDIAGSDDNTAFSINGLYSAGAMTLGAAYETHDVKGAGDEDAFRLMASYKVGSLKLVGFYQDETNDPTVAGLLGGATVDATVVGVGAAYKLGAGTVKAQYYTRDVDGTDTDPELIAIGYDHKLGKKTDIYAQYANVSDGSIGGAGHGEKVGPDAGGDAGGVSIGIRHKF